MLVVGDGPVLRTYQIRFDGGESMSIEQLPLGEEYRLRHPTDASGVLTGDRSKLIRQLEELRRADGEKWSMRNEYSIENWEAE